MKNGPCENCDFGQSLFDITKEVIQYLFCLSVSLGWEFFDNSLMKQIQVIFYFVGMYEESTDFT